MTATEFDFTQWFDIFLDEVKRLGYHGPVDRDSAESDYDSGLSPEHAAKLFVDEMNDD